MLGLPLRSSNPDLADKKYIAAMFASDEQGAWYDPSDLSTMYQDAAGTIPVTAVGQPVGLMLDKSKGLYGPELVTNGTFATNVVGWSLADATASITWVSGGFANVKMLTNTGSGAFQDITAASGIAKVSIRARKVGSSGNTYLEVHARGTLLQKLRGITLTNQSFANYEFVVPATNNGFRVYLKVEYAGAEMEIDSVSVQELPGNHATQSTTASRPTLSARVNLLTNTETFSSWYIYGMARVESNEQAPIGNSTAILAVDTVTDSQEHYFNLNLSGVLLPNTTYRFSIYVKKASVSSGRFSLVANWGGTFTFNLNSMSIPVGGTLRDVGNGWYLASILANTTTQSSGYVRFQNASAGSIYNYSGDGVSGFYLWGADLRVANESAKLPSYQRVNTSTDYDTAGFPYYLLFDGVDDYLSTGSINFTGTDKMTVFAGVRKLSDAAGFLAELSAERVVNNGAWSLIAPGGLGVRQGYYFSSKGTLDSSNGVDSGYASPITNILTGLGDISGDLATLRVNGTQAASRTADQGTGNYGNYPLYIGRRGGTELPFKGHLYGLIVRGAQTDDLHLTHAEKYLAYKSGVTL